MNPQIQVTVQWRDKHGKMTIMEVSGWMPLPDENYPLDKAVSFTGQIAVDKIIAKRRAAAHTENQVHPFHD